METTNLAVGSRIDHELHGPGVVTFVGADHLGIDFDRGGEALIRRDALERDLPPTRQAVVEPARQALPWPDSTFVPEGKDARHFPGSHWEPFVAQPSEILMRLPEMMSAALPQTTADDRREPPRALPEGWPKGLAVVWPQRTQGLAVVVCAAGEGAMIDSLFPFFGSGSLHTLTLAQVKVFGSGLEAQVTAYRGDAELTFYDTRYLIHRAWYEADRDYDFILTGIAYSAHPAEKREWQVTRHPDEVAWLNRRLKEGEQPLQATCTVSLQGAAAFLPVDGWDVDDYSFHAPVKSVEGFKDWLGQDGWRLRATVMREGDEDFDLDVVVTRRAWKGEAPPQAGQDIEGQLWLQAYLLGPR